MDTDIQRIRLPLKGRLNAVAVMGVKIKDHDPLPAIVLLPVTGGHHAVIKKTEAKRPDPFGMMARRPDQTKSLLRPTLLQQINGRESGPGGQCCHLIRIITDLIIGMINRGPAGEHRFLKTKEPALIMDRLQPSPFRRTTALKIQGRPGIIQFQGSKNGLKPGRDLGMVAAGIVIQETGIGDKCEQRRKMHDYLTGKGLETKWKAP